MSDLARQSRPSFGIVLPGIFWSKAGSGTAVLKAGGDVRVARILMRRPTTAPNPVLITSRAAIEAFQNELGERVEAVSIDGLFDRASTNLLVLSVFLAIRGVCSLIALTLPREGRAMRVVYTPSNTLPDAIVGYLAKKLRPGRTWVAVVHHIPERARLAYGEAEARASRLALEAGLTLICRGADQLVAYHEPTIRRILELGYEEEDIVINANGVDVSEFRPAPLPRGGRAPGVVVCVGRLSRQKGTPAMLRAWAAVVKTLSDCRLILIGAEDTLSCTQVRQIAEALGISSSVHVMGSLPRPQVVDALRTASLVAAPSFVEGWGIAVLEALACGTPVVAWDLEAYAPFAPAVTVVPLNDESALSAAIINLLGDEHAWGCRSRDGVEVAGRYSWDTVASLEWQTLERAVELASNPHTQE